jgi:hypothetical protein
MSQYYGSNLNGFLSSVLSKISPGFADNVYKELKGGFWQDEFAPPLEELNDMVFSPPTLRANQPMSIGGIDGGGGPNPGSPPSISPSYSFSPSFSTPEPPSPYSPSDSTPGTSGTPTDEDSTSSTTNSDSSSSSSSSSTPDPDSSTPDSDSKGDSTSPSIGPDSEDPGPTISPPWPPPPKSTSGDDSTSSYDPPTVTSPDPPTPSSEEETTDPKDCIPIGGGTITPNPPTSFNDLPKEDCGPDCPCCGAEPGTCCEDAWADCVTLTCLYHKEKCTCDGSITISFCSPSEDGSGGGQSPQFVGADCCEGNDDCEICLTTKYAYTWNVTCSLACWNANCPITGTVDTTTCKPCCDGY